MERASVLWFTKSFTIFIAVFYVPGHTTDRPRHLSKKQETYIIILLIVFISFCSGVMTLLGRTSDLASRINGVIDPALCLILAVITYLMFEKELQEKHFVFLILTVACAVFMWVIVGDLFHIKALEINMNSFDLDHDGVFSG